MTSPLPLGDVQLVGDVRRGGAQAAVAERAFVERYAARLRRYAQKHLRDRQAAEDLVQDVLVTVLEAMREGRLADPARLGSFVLSTCRHKVWDTNRAEGRRDRLRRQVETEPIALPRAIDVDRRSLERCLMALEPRDAAIVLLTYVEEHSAKDIAARFGTTPGNVRVLRHRTLSRLATCLGGEP